MMSGEGSIGADSWRPTITDSWLVLHQLIHEGIQSFLNAEYQTRLGKLLYPYLDQHDMAQWGRWRNEVLDSVRELEHRTAFPDILALKLDTFGVAEALSRVFSWAWENYPPDCAERGSLLPIPCLRRFDMDMYQAQGPYVAPVTKLWRYAQHGEFGKLVKGLYIHGSLSTLDYVAGSSDLDMVAVVTKDTLISPERLLALRKYLLHTLRWIYQIDYSQHHGYFIISELDLRFYDDTWFPGVLFAISTVLVGDDLVKIHRRKAQSEATGPFRRMRERIHQVASASSQISGWYAVKLHLQGILLLPTLYLQARGTPTYKRDSFELVRGHVPPSAWEVIDKISAIRAMGLQGALISPWLDRQIAKMPCPWMASILHRRFKNGVPATVWEVLGDDWLRQSVQLADTLADRLRDEGYLS